MLRLFKKRSVNGAFARLQSALLIEMKCLIFLLKNSIKKNSIKKGPGVSAAN